MKFMDFEIIESELLYFFTEEQALLIGRELAQRIDAEIEKAFGDFTHFGTGVLRYDDVFPPKHVPLSAAKVLL